MKKVLIVIICLIAATISFSQPAATVPNSTAKIKLTNDQKIIIESSTETEASLAMGMELTGTTSSVNALVVKNSNNTGYIISNTLTKMKVSMNMMGQSNNYDSENKESNSEEMAKVFDDALNKPVDVVIDNSTGRAIKDNKKAKKADDDAESNPAADMMQMFADNSDDAIVSTAFEIVPQGKKIGDSWADTISTKDMKTISKYTLTAVSGNEATVQADIIATAVNKLDFQEMEFEIKTETKTRGEIITDINTGLVKKRTTTAEITGSFQMMGQDMQISAKVISTSTYK